MTSSSLFSLTQKENLTEFQTTYCWVSCRHSCIRCDFIKWYRTYLTDHTEYVNFNGKESAEHTLKCGVPQGSILGRLFFYYLLDDIFYVFNVLSTLLHADDHCTYLIGIDINALFNVSNIKLAALLEWLSLFILMKHFACYFIGNVSKLII